MLAMRKLLAAAAVAVSATTANAEAFIPSGAWATFQTVVTGTKRPLCGMQTAFPKSGASIMIKYILGDKGLLFHFFKNDWRFPKDRMVELPLIVGFDRTYSQSIAAKGGLGESSGDPMIEFKIGNGLDTFLNQFAEADVMWIEFPQGDEPRWEARMIGSRKAAQMFRNCIVNIIDANKPAATTQPYGRAPTQPYASGKKPTQPVKQPGAKDDDGSI